MEIGSPWLMVKEVMHPSSLSPKLLGADDESRRRARGASTSDSEVGVEGVDPLSAGH